MPGARRLGRQVGRLAAEKERRGDASSPDPLENGPIVAAWKTVAPLDSYFVWRTIVDGPDKLKMLEMADKDGDKALVALIKILTTL